MLNCNHVDYRGNVNQLLSRHRIEIVTAGNRALAAVVGITIGNTLALGATIRSLARESRGSETIEGGDEQTYAHQRHYQAAKR